MIRHLNQPNERSAMRSVGEQDQRLRASLDFLKEEEEEEYCEDHTESCPAGCLRACSLHTPHFVLLRWVIVAVVRVTPHLMLVLCVLIG
jgi:hypothetical protein